jgi:hypothetical protein
VKKSVLFGLILAAGLILLSSCTEVAKPLEGTWTVTSVETRAGARTLGNGTITLDFATEFIGIEVYTGTGTFVSGTFDYLATASWWPGVTPGVDIKLYEIGQDPDVDAIELVDLTYTAGNTLSGDYSGIGVYLNGAGTDIGDGTFTATR